MHNMDAYMTLGDRIKPIFHLICPTRVSQFTVRINEVGNELKYIHEFLAHILFFRRNTSVFEVWIKIAFRRKWFTLLSDKVSDL